MKEQKEDFVRDKPIPEFKKKIVEEFKKEIEENRTILIASCKGLPGHNFHEIKKKLRGKAEIRFARKSAINRAIDGIEKGSLKNLKKEIDADFAIIFSDLDAFELSGLLTDNESPSKAKAGDIAPEDIEIEPGPTELIAGPAISELQGVGLKVKVTDGKLEIMQGAVVVKKGDEVTGKVAGVLAKLDFTPMKVGFIPLAAYDSKDDKVYTDIVIDKEGTLEELKNLVGKALGFAVSVGFVNEKTIVHFIAKACAEEKALDGLIKEEKKEDNVEQSSTNPRSEDGTSEVINEGNKPANGDEGAGEKEQEGEKKEDENVGDDDKKEEEKVDVKEEEKKVEEEIKEEVKEEIKEEIPESPETKTKEKKEEAAEKVAEEVAEEVVEDINDDTEKKEEQA